MQEHAKEAYQSGLIDGTEGNIWSVVLILKMVAFILIFLSCVLHPSFGQESPAPKNVLIIMMDVSGRAFVDPFESSLRARFHGDVSFFEAYLGESPPPTQPYLASMAEELRSRFAQTKLDLVIAVHPETLDFMIQYHDQVFPGVPIVYCGVGTRIYGGKRWPGMTGWTSPEPFGETIDFALHLQPDTQAVAVLAGEPTNPTWLETTRSELSRFSGRIREIDILDPAGPDVLKRVEALPPRTIVLFNILVYRKGDARLRGYDLLEAVSKLRPTYAAFESLCLNHGCIGGEYEDSDKLAESVAGTAERILSGERPDDIPPERNANLQGRVDWQAFQHWKLNPRNLPPGTVLLNKPPSLWDSYRDYVLVALSVISLQLLLIAGLLLQRRLRRDAENRLRTIFDGAVEGIYRTTPKGRFLIANPAMASMLGYDSPEDLIASVSDLPQDVWFDPEDRAKYTQALDERGTVRGFASRFKRKGGEVVWLSLSGKKVSNAEGRTRYYEGFAEEVTRLKRSEMELREREERLKQAEVIALMGHSSWDVDTNITTWSEGMFRITGWDPLKPAPRHEERASLYTAGSWARLSQAVQHSLATGEPYDLEVQIARPDSDIRWARALGKAVRDDSGRVHRLIGTLQDITEQKLAEITLRDSEERFRATFEQAAVGIVHVSFSGQVLRCNTHFAEFLGYSPGEIAGMSLEQFTSVEHLSRTSELLKELAGGGHGGAGLEKRYIRKDGTLRWGRLTSSVQRDGNGQPLHLVSFVEDITERRSAEEHLAKATTELQASEIRHRTVFQTSLDALSISRLSDGRLIEVNNAYVRLMGFERDELIEHTTVELGIWITERKDIVDELYRNSNFRDLEIEYRRKNGSTFWGLTSATLIEMDGESCVLFALRDVSDAKEAVKTIRDLAFYDPLTHLPNRRSLLDLLEQTHGAETRARALLFVDLDNFKALNDALGHHAGDLLLQEAAQRLAACVRGEGTVARIGGDEFAVVLENLSRTAGVAAEQAKQAAERILAAVALPYLAGGHECHFSSSIGITIFEKGLNSGREALQQGEIAMSKAKEAGRNRIRFFSPDLQANVNARVQLENELRKAIKVEEFELYFQPQVQAGRLIGSEALVRWKHPLRGILPPGEFIELAEETGLILPLGNWGLWKACEQIAEWAARYPSAEASVSVNISGRLFSQPDFIERVLATLDATGANAASLKLEITETSLVEDFQEAVAKMTELKSHGLRFSIDDFGTGYSSLAYLKSLPIDQLKIDRAFVKDILVDGPSGAIAQAIVSLGRSMGFAVIAEGVETEEQRDFLLGIGCDCFQGYLFGRPVPAEEFERNWLRQNC